ncbi:hypothetical protein ACFFIF_08600 [Vagococcus entomophilus]|uniref:Membrane protein 6-pyruvoyl-tetrahydropterin synthase-related domain-containing protein n=1 Tax=Vagococcus entomophilus TaxID=1160095 RepID=A0A430AH05_9ENTE|nr:hypothetical protein [Vagococcus entomophilus]RSU07178.1 hypothetical protein CBF30_07965 [Vagococcus entomophilus]
MKNKSVWPIFWIILVPNILLVPFIIHHSTVISGDTLFHFNRFYETAMQWKNHNFQYFISMYGFSQSARIVNALYSPFLAYFYGALVLVCQSWFKFQLLAISINSAVAGLSMYYALKTNKVSTKNATILAILYSTTGGVLRFTTRTNFIGIGAALLPFGLAAATRMTRNVNSKNLVNVLELTFAMSILIQSHLLTAIELVLILIAFFVVAFLKTKDKRTLLLAVSKAVGLTLVLTSNIWGAMLELYTKDHILRPILFSNPAQASIRSFGFTNLTLPLAVLLLMIGATSFYYRTITTLTQKMTFIVGSVFFICSTDLLPWSWMFANIQGLSILQMPLRLFAPALALLLISAGLLAEEIPKKRQDFFTKGLLIGTLVSLLFSLTATYQVTKVFTTSDVIKDSYAQVSKRDPDEIRASFNQGLLAPLQIMYKATPDYLPVQSSSFCYEKEDPYVKYEKQVIENPLKVRKTVENNELILTWVSNNRKEVMLPIVDYANTQIWLNQHLLKHEEVKRSSIGVLYVTPKKGLNEVRVTYAMDKKTKFLILLSLFAWGGLLLYIAIKIWKKCMRKPTYLISRR